MSCGSTCCSSCTVTVLGTSSSPCSARVAVTVMVSNWVTGRSWARSMGGVISKARYPWRASDGRFLIIASCVRAGFLVGRMRNEVDNQMQVIINSAEIYRYWTSEMRVGLFLLLSGVVHLAAGQWLDWRTPPRLSGPPALAQAVALPQLVRVAPPAPPTEAPPEPEPEVKPQVAPPPKPTVP